MIFYEISHLGFTHFYKHADFSVKGFAIWFSTEQSDRAKPPHSTSLKVPPSSETRNTKLKMPFY